MGLSLKEALAYYWQHITVKLDERLTIDPEVTEEGAANLINADSLGGVLASEYALKEDLDGVSIALDSTLTLEGTAADAAAVGTALEGKVNKAGDTMTGPLTITKANGVPLFLQSGNENNSGATKIQFHNGEGTFQGGIFIDYATHQMRFISNKGRNEYYNLPAPSTDEGADTVGYSILTTKAAVTIAQGGTGATNVQNARVNLLFSDMTTITALTNALVQGVSVFETPSTATGTGDPTGGVVLTAARSINRGMQIANGYSAGSLKWRFLHSQQTSDAGVTGYSPWYTIYHSGNIDTLMTEITNRLSNASGVSF